MGKEDTGRWKSHFIVGLYKQVVGRVYNRRPVVTVSDHTATYSACVLFCDLTLLTGRTHVEMMEAAINRFSKEWCLRVFGNPYVPLTVAVGEKTRKWLVGNFKPVAKTVDDSEKQAKEMLEVLLQTMTVKQVTELVMGGWPDDPSVREAMERELNG